MFFINIYRFSFSVFKLLLILINANLFLEHSSVGAAIIPKLDNYQHYASGRSGNVEGVCQGYCTTPACQSFENTLAYIMNPSVDPCDDFYEFVCGNFKNNFPLKSQFNTFQWRNDYSVGEIIRVLNDGIKDFDTSSIRKLKIYYQNCMNKRRTEEGEKVFSNILNKIGGWPVLLGDKWNESNFNFMSVIYAIIEANFPTVFPIQLNFKHNNYKRKILTIHQPYTTINKMFFNQSDSTLIDAYFKLMVDTAVSLGANKSVAEKEFLDVVRFEAELYMASREEDRVPAVVNLNFIKNLPQTEYTISWFEMILKVTGTRHEFSEADEISIFDQYYFEKLDELLTKTPKRVLANYMAWCFINLSLRYQHENLEQLLNEFNKVAGQLKLPEYRCYDDMMVNLPKAISALFVRMNYNPYQNQNKAVKNLFKILKEQFRLNLYKTEWLDEETRLQALKKIDAMTVELPFHNKLLGDEVDQYYKNLKINPGSYFESFLNASSFNRKKLFEDLYVPLRARSWSILGNAFETNAKHWYTFNHVDILAGLIVEPFYNLQRPQYINYGGAGSTIGHEITHGFDARGRLFDEYGNDVNWWTSESEDNFLKKTECMIDQYNNFILPQTGQSVNGSITLNENIADNNGFKIAYGAYKRWASRNNVIEDCLPSVKYTPQQLFWISAAKNWCATAQLPKTALTDNHSPSQARIINSFSNIKEFSEDFKCRPGSRMNPVKKCIVW